jgi:hypothetical protein
MATLQSLTVNDTANLTLPVGTSANRPTINSTVVSFTTVGTTTWTAPAGVTQLEVLVVGGGGGGGYEMGGGGGGGGVLYDSAFPVTPATVYTVTVGGGGTGRTSNSDNTNNAGSSVFSTITALGGGAGGSNSYPYDGSNSGSRPQVGGSGGGSGENSSNGRIVGAPGTLGQGFEGGGAIEAPRYQSGGGGGAGGPGKTAVADGFGDGGPGRFSNISGSPAYYGGGGGGGCYLTGTPGKGGIGGGGAGGTPNPSSGATPGVAGTANTGGGGGGGSYATSQPGGAGGSGIVIIRYSLTPDSTLPTAQTRFNSVTGALEVYETNNQWNAQAVGKNIETHGLVLYVDGARYTSGTTWPDLSGLGNDVTLVNGPTYSSANGGTLVFDGSNDYGNIATFTGKPTVQITCEAWIYPTRTPSIGTIRGGVISSTNSMYHGIIDSSDDGLTHSLHVANQTSVSRTGSVIGKVPQNQWSHITMTYDGVRNRGFINGELVYDVAQTGTITDGTYVIGTYGQGLTDGVHNFLGNIAVARIYNRALSNDEIIRNFNAESSRFQKYIVPKVPQVVTGDLAIYLDAANPASFIDRQNFNGTWYDIGGPGNHGTLASGAAYSIAANTSSVIFDGVDDTVTFNAYKVPGVARSFFIWVRFSSLTHSSGYQLMGTQEGNAYTYIGIANGGSIYYYAGASTGGDIGNNVTVNTWVNLGFVLYSNGYRIIYKNGVPVHVNTGDLGGTAGTYNFTLGNINGNHWLNGYLSVAQLYLRPLSAAEVMQNFAALRHRHGI